MDECENVYISMPVKVQEPGSHITRAWQPQYKSMTVTLQEHACHKSNASCKAMPVVGACYHENVCVLTSVPPSFANLSEGLMFLSPLHSTADCISFGLSFFKPL